MKGENGFWDVLKDSMFEKALIFNQYVKKLVKHQWCYFTYHYSVRKFGHTIAFRFDHKFILAIGNSLETSLVVILCYYICQIIIKMFFLNCLYISDLKRLKQL